jgi:hypothetical protein
MRSQSMIALSLPQRTGHTAPARLSIARTSADRQREAAIRPAPANSYPSANRQRDTAIRFPPWANTHTDSAARQPTPAPANNYTSARRQYEAAIRPRPSPQLHIGEQTTRSCHPPPLGANSHASARRQREAAIRTGHAGNTTAIGASPGTRPRHAECSQSQSW